MNEEPIEFPLNTPEDIEGIIKSHLRDAGITAQISKSNNNFTVTTKEKVPVPEEIMSIIRVAVEIRGYTVKFLTV